MMIITLINSDEEYSTSTNSSNLNSNTYFFYTHRGPPKQSVGRAGYVGYQMFQLLVLILKVTASPLDDIINLFIKIG